jgi:hypothetical protein
MLQGFGLQIEVIFAGIHFVGWLGREILIGVKCHLFSSTLAGFFRTCRFEASNRHFLRQSSFWVLIVHIPTMTIDYVCFCFHNIILSLGR